MRWTSYETIHTNQLIVGFFQTFVASVVFLLKTFIFQEKYPWMQNISLHMKSIDNFPGKIPVISLVHINDTSPLGCKFENLYIKITKCMLKSLKSRNVQHSQNMIIVINSTFDHLQIIGKHKVLIKNSHSEIRHKRHLPVIQAVDSILTIENCSFHGNGNTQVSRILEASFSTVYIDCVNFDKLNATSGVILADNNTKLSLNQVNFTQNGDYSTSSLVRLSGGSTANIVGCNFYQNKGMNGSCLQAGKQSEVFLKNSNFEGNVGITSGGVIFSELDAVLSVDSCTFRSNSAWFITSNATWMTGGGGVLFAEQSVKLSILNTVFFNNSCINYKYDFQETASYREQLYRLLKKYYFENLPNSQLQVHRLCQGGGIAATKASINVVNSTFEHNFADYGGSAIFAGDQSNLKIKMSNFSNNTGNPHTGSVICQNLCVVSVHNCNFTKNVGIVDIGQYKDSKLSITNSYFRGNVGYSLIKCTNTSLQIISSDFRQNGAIDGIYSEIRETEGTNGRYVDDTIVDVYGSSTVEGSITSSLFTNNAITYIFNADVSTSLHIESDFMFNQGCVIEVTNGAFLTVLRSTFVQNTVLDYAVVSCKGCSGLSVTESVFSENDARGHNAVFVSESPTSIVTRNCTFTDNRHGIFLGPGQSITVQDSVFNYTKWNLEDTQYNLIDLEYSNVTVLNSFLQISTKAFIVIRVETLSHFNLSSTVVKGLVTFVITEGSVFDIDNCSLLDEGDEPMMSDYGQIQLNLRARLTMKNTLVHQHQFRFIYSEGLSSTNILNCTMNFTSSTNQMRLKNSYLTLTHSHIFWNEMTLIKPWSKTDNLIHSTNTEVVLTKSRCKVFNKINLLKFEYSNVSLDNSSFESGYITFVNGIQNFLLLINCSLSAATPLLIPNCAENILIHFSTVHLDFLSNCSKSGTVEALRLYQSTIFIDDPMHQVKKLLTWKSTLHIGNIGLSSDRKLFPAVEAILSGANTCPLSDTISPSTDQYVGFVSESRFAAGKFAFLTVLQSLKIIASSNAEVPILFLQFNFSHDALGVWYLLLFL